MRGLLFGALLLGCSASGETGAPSDPNQAGTSGHGGSEQAGGAGSGGEATAGTSGTGAGGSGGTPDLCQSGDSRLCSCAPTYGGSQTCGDFGWNLCVCPGWPPPGAGGSSGAPSGPSLGSDCTTGTDDCASMEAPAGKPSVCMQSDGLAGGTERPGHCTWTCTPGAADSIACIDQGGKCKTVGELVSHCVVW